MWLFLRRFLSKQCINIDNYVHRSKGVNILVLITCVLKERLGCQTQLKFYNSTNTSVRSRGPEEGPT